MSSERQPGECPPSSPSRDLGSVQVLDGQGRVIAEGAGAVLTDWAYVQRGTFVEVGRERPVEVVPVGAVVEFKCKR